MVAGRRSQLSHLGLIAICLLTVACRGPTSRRDHASSLTVLYPGDERILSPTWDMPAKLLMFLPLVRHDERGELQGVLARSWTHEPASRSWTVHLRSDVRWHDGVPFTAHDVKFTLELYQHHDVLWRPPGSAVVTVLDDTTFTVTDRTGCGPDLLETYEVYYPKHVLEHLEPGSWGQWDFWTRPVGNGPYRYVRHVPKTMMEFEANADYHGGRPAVDHLVLKFGEASVVELTSGNVDVAGWVVPTEARRLARDPRFQAFWSADADPRAILWRASHPLFRDPSVRRAMTHAINRRELQGVLDFPEGLPVSDGPMSPRGLWHGTLPDPLSYDPELAGRLLAQAGWTDTDGDGVRERDGVRFRFELLVPSELQDVGVFVQDQLRRVGVEVDFLTLPNPNIRRLWRSRGDFAALIEFVPDRWLESFFGDGSVLGYENARVARLLRELACTVDRDARDTLYRQMLPEFQAEQPATFLFPMIYWFVMDRRIRGLNSPWRADPLINLERVWLEDARP